MKSLLLPLLAALGLAQAAAQFHPRYKGGQLHVDIQRQRGQGPWESLNKASRLCDGDRLRFELSAEPKQWVRLYTQDRSEPSGASFSPYFVEVGSTPLTFPSGEPLLVGPSALGDRQEHFVFLVANGRPAESYHCAAMAAVGRSCAQARSDGPLYREIGVILEDLPGLSNAPEATKAGLLTIVLEHPPKCP